MGGYEHEEETTVGPADGYEKLIVPEDERPESSPDSPAHRPTAQVDEPNKRDKVDESLYIDTLGRRIV
jgi:hypothetical protein